ncbi:S-layer homology domain-containing protein [Citricoccus alkalitolerans]|uniref:S-layer homology domain-containing protein n=1 Tax=Citricoccus alkalitolerans TaxID=246603 RepID=A0ABV8XXR0_9MICC
MPPVSARPSSVVHPARRRSVRALLTGVLALMLSPLLVASLFPMPALAAPAADAAPQAVTSEAACPAGASGANFADDLASFGNSVEWMVRQCVTTGYADGTFRAGRAISRAEVAAFLYRMSGESYTGGAPRSFSDVTAGTVHRNAILWATTRGITTGYADGTFEPSGQITRGELAAFMHRYAGRPAVSVPAPFPDLAGQQRAYYYGPAHWMRSLGVTGYSDGTFRAGRDVTRGETSKFLYLVNGVVKDRPGLSLWTETAVNLYAQDDWRAAPVLSTLPAQTGLEWVRDSSGLAQVRVGGRTGWVNKGMLSTGQPGTAAKPYPRDGSFEQKVANNIAPWCWKPQISVISGRTSYANMRLRYQASGDRILVEKEEGLQITGMIADPNHVSSRAIQLHECAHLLQYRAYGYLDATDRNGQLSVMDRDLNRVYGNDNGVEHLADCMADVMGAQRDSREYTVGYGGECTSAHLAAARQLIAGKRFSEPAILNTVPNRHEAPFTGWQEVSRPDVPVRAVASD